MLRSRGNISVFFLIRTTGNISFNTGKSLGIDKMCASGKYIHMICVIGWNWYNVYIAINIAFHTPHACGHYDVNMNLSHMYFHYLQVISFP